MRRLARKLQREVQSWGDEMRLTDAYYTVSRCFGYDDMRDLERTVGYAELSLPDQHLEPQQREERFSQYVDVLASNDFSIEEAVDIVSRVRAYAWWGSEAPKPELVVGHYVVPAAKQMQFRDIAAVARFHRSLKREIWRLDMILPFGCRTLMAKIFGFETFTKMLEVAGHGVPTPSDWYVSPEELDDRVRGYLGVLKQVGVSDVQAIGLVRNVSAEGWWGLERDEWVQAPRQAKHADRVEGSGWPTWRPARVRQL